MNHAKTFRLFISSTFSDFRKEREVLQTEVFPMIKEYASSKGYTFQPIDLRWGVSHEAQLDQKTLELCLDEVRNCKSYPYPNFLLMLGDRYGWVPLPYAIEENEFNALKDKIPVNKEITIEYKGSIFVENWKKLKNNLEINCKYKIEKYEKKIRLLEKLKKLQWSSMQSDLTMRDFHYQFCEFCMKTIDGNDKEKIDFHVSKVTNNEELLSWYQLDKNQLPASYILNNRVNEYEEYDIWVAEENILRTLLQEAAKSVYGKESDEYKNYITSATEAEIIEGIVSYKHETKHQQSLSSDVKQIDSKHVFGFFRDIDENSIVGNKFKVSDEDYKEAQRVKVEVKKILTKGYIPNKISQINKEELDYSYIEEFAQKITDFLKKQIDEQKEVEDKQSFTPLQIERENQQYFAEQKRKDFLETNGLRDLLDKIEQYIEDENESPPLVISGKSGSGKSALMAKAIEEAEKKKSKQVIYRFVGATANSGYSKEILTSIFDELGIDISVKKAKERLNSLQDQGTFKEFSDCIYDEINKLEEDVVVFIDGVDQLSNDDQFLWLPNELKSNVKIIISALNDENYHEDSKYFKILKNKTVVPMNMHGFDEPLNLLKVLLEKDDRTLQRDHEEYFLGQYTKAMSPLYVVIAAAEMKYWKSEDYTENNPLYKSGKKQSLELSQKGIVKEFIENLSEVYRHNKRFVMDVLGYIYASRDGLSESELLQLLATDQGLIKEVAPDDFHTNITGELPMVHWSRLHAQLKPFLSLKTQDDEVLMCFFHREFKNTSLELFNSDDLKKYHDIMSEFYKKLFHSFLEEYHDQIDGKQSIASIRTLRKVLYHLHGCGKFDDLKEYLGDYLFVYSSIFNFIPMEEKIMYFEYFDLHEIKLFLLDRIYELNEKHIEYAGAFAPFEPTIIISRGLYQPLRNLGLMFENLRCPRYAIEIYEFAVKKDKEFFGDNYIFIAGHLYSMATIYSELGDLKNAEKYYNDVLKLKNPEDISSVYNVYNKAFYEIYQDFYFKQSEYMLELIHMNFSENQKDNMTIQDFKNILEKQSMQRLFDESQINSLFESIHHKDYEQLLDIIVSNKKNYDTNTFNLLMYECNLRIAQDYIQENNYANAINYLVSAEKVYLIIDPHYKNYKSIKLLSSIALCLFKEKDFVSGELYFNNAYEIWEQIQDGDSYYKHIFNLAKIEYERTIGMLYIMFNKIIENSSNTEYIMSLLDLTIEEIEKDEIYIHPISLQILLIKANLLKRTGKTLLAIDYVRKIKHYSSLVYENENNDEYLMFRRKLASLSEEIMSEGYLI